MSLYKIVATASLISLTPISAYAAGNFLADDGTFKNVSNSQLPTMPANTIKCNNTGVAAVPGDCTGAQTEAILSFTATQTGAVLRSLSSRLGDTVNYLDFGPTMDCTTDDSAKLQAAINAVPGGTVLMPTASFCSAIAVTVTNTTGVRILGQRHGEHHDVGAADVGNCQFKWTGAAAGTMFNFAPISGVGNQRMNGGGIIGCTLDGNADLGGVGLALASTVHGVFDFSATRWSNSAMTVGVVATLGEAKDAQNNIIHLVADQSNTGDGRMITLNGDSTSNASFNEIYLHGVYKNGIPFECTNCDNNLIDTYLFQFPAGTAAAGVQCDSAATAATCRNNFFRRINVSPQAGNKSLWMQGTETNTNPSLANQVLSFDMSNTSIPPTYGTGVIRDWINDATMDHYIGGTLTIGYGSAIGAAYTTTFTPNITCGAGTPTTITPAFRYTQIGKSIKFNLSMSLVNIGTCTGALIFTIPIAADTSVGAILSSANISTGVLEYAHIAPSGTTGIVSVPSTGAFPGINTNFINVSGTYETQ
jgi:hypothetical protein